MKFIDAPQGSEAWLQARVGKITASRYKDARDRLKPAKGKTIGEPSAKCTAYAAQVAVERIAGRPVEKAFENWQMREGTEQEPHARAAYDLETGNIVDEVGAIVTDDDLFLYSPDGLVGDDGLLEIKTILSPERIVRVIGEGDLSEYMDQCLGGLWLTGRKWIDLVLWCPALESIGRQLTVHHITRDENAIEALEADLIAFARMVQEKETQLRALFAANESVPAELLAEAA
jgi:exodeoxyribonuclease (lambda-induced)